MSSIIFLYKKQKTGKIVLAMRETPKICDCGLLRPRS